MKSPVWNKTKSLITMGVKLQKLQPWWASAVISVKSIYEEWRYNRCRSYALREIWEEIHCENGTVDWPLFPTTRHHSIRCVCTLIWALLEGGIGVSILQLPHSNTMRHHNTEEALMGFLVHTIFTLFIFTYLSSLAHSLFPYNHRKHHCLSSLLCLVSIV